MVSRCKVGWQRAGRNGNRSYTPAATAKAELDIGWAAKTAMRIGGHILYECPVTLSFLAAFPVPASWSKSKKAMALEGKIAHSGKPDIDNILKMIDGLKGIVWKDDSQVVHIGDCLKCYSEIPRLEMRIEPFNKNMSSWLISEEFMLD